MSCLPAVVRAYIGAMHTISPIYKYQLFATENPGGQKRLVKQSYRRITGAGLKCGAEIPGVYARKRDRLAELTTLRVAWRYSNVRAR